MTATVLVAYGSKHGSTKEVAAAIADTLDEQGLRADLRPADDVETLAGYDGVVIGGALYAGRLHKDVRHLLRRFHEELAARPVAVFAMGPLSLKADEVAGSRRQLDAALRKAADVKPFSIEIFGGVVHPQELHFPFNKMPETDARDWAAIEAWAKELAASLAGSGVAVG
jgi:menaquinone-dependent protoporphyrinogen oxidase